MSDNVIMPLNEELLEHAKDLWHISGPITLCQLAWMWLYQDLLRKLITFISTQYQGHLW